MPHEYKIIAYSFEELEPRLQEGLLRKALSSRESPLNSVVYDANEFLRERLAELLPDMQARLAFDYSWPGIDAISPDLSGDIDVEIDYAIFLTKYSQKAEKGILRFSIGYIEKKPAIRYVLYQTHKNSGVSWDTKFTDLANAFIEYAQPLLVELAQKAIEESKFEDCKNDALKELKKLSYFKDGRVVDFETPDRPVRRMPTRYR